MIRKTRVYPAKRETTKNCEEDKNMKTIIAYFSAEGTTGAVAKEAAQKLDAETFEIAPQVPYTSADINWRNPLSRCNREKLGKKDVPVTGRIEDFDTYDLVCVGFPIWYYGAPNVINTFCKGYDWSGKKVIVFATSGGSDIGKTVDRLAPYIKGADVLDAKVIHTADELCAMAEKA